MARKDPSSPAREVRDISLKFNSVLIITLGHVTILQKPNDGKRLALQCDTFLDAEP